MVLGMIGWDREGTGEGTGGGAASNRAFSFIQRKRVSSLFKSSRKHSDCKITKPRSLLACRSHTDVSIKSFFGQGSFRSPCVQL